MKRSLSLVLIIIVFAVSLLGCAHTQTATYTLPKHLADRMIRIGGEVSSCIRPKNDLEYYISSFQEPNAWVTEDKLYFTEGIFVFDDDVLKFIMSHEIAHNKLGHLAKVKTVSYITTGVMIVADIILPGVGILNYWANPAIVNNFSKKQEFEADTEASKACLCLGISISEQIEMLKKLKSATDDSGGFWDQHPSWDERIENIKKTNIVSSPEVTP
jgi:Zn-dependent protease with chaperone function